jgi:hypothetical protein
MHIRRDALRLSSLLGRLYVIPGSSNSLTIEFLIVNNFRSYEKYRRFYLIRLE